MREKIPLKEKKQRDSFAWKQRAAEQMARQGMGMRQAAQEQGMALTAEEAEGLFRQKVFQRLLWIERNKYYKELASDPNRTKQSAIGLMWLSIQKLAEQGDWDKALEGLLKLAKVEGWVGAEGQTNVFATLSAKDFEEIKKEMQKLTGTKASEEAIN